MDIPAFIIGILAVAFFLLSYQMKKRRQIILCNSLSRGLYILQYILLFAFEGAILDVLGIASSLLATKKDTPFIKRHYVAVVVCIDLVITAVGLLLYKNIFSLFPIVGVLLHTTAFWITSEKKIRLLSLFGSPFWLVYNVSSKAWGSAIGDALTILSILVAIIRYDLLGKKRKLYRGRHTVHL